VELKVGAVAGSKRPAAADAEAAHLTVSMDTSPSVPDLSCMEAVHATWRLLTVNVTESVQSVIGVRRQRNGAKNNSNKKPQSNLGRAASPPLTGRDQLNSRFHVILSRNKWELESVVPSRYRVRCSL